ncbi:MAG: hypothetical protein M1837_006240 [Sclerophora amabilis]|nr:MAG: hypothetical protein M1837_006240 [Sclerophora amabilis]
MPAKKATTAAPKKAAAPASHASYKDMIKEAILNLKERNGSSRQAIKKYVQANNTINAASPSIFDSQFNRALKAGVENDDFAQPKGPSGTVKLVKKEHKPAAAKSTAKKPASSTTKTAAPKKATTTKKPATKAAAAPKKAAAKPKANASKPRKTATAAPAVTEKPTVLGKTKSGRVTKTTAKPAPKKAATTKKPAAKKATTPKKKAESATPAA